MSKRGQVTIEYFILFAVMTLVTAIGFARYNSSVTSSLKGWFQTATGRMAGQR